jgi:hypothetical protein
MVISAFSSVFLLGYNISMLELASIQPLEYPQWWFQRSWLDRFLVGMPLVGTDKRLYSECYDQLQKRDPYKCSELWEKYPLIYPLSQRISPIIQDCFRWPNHLFIPRDLCGLLCLDPHFVADSDMFMIRDIKYELKLSKHGLPNEVFDGPGTLMYFELLERLLRYSQNNS